MKKILVINITSFKDIGALNAEHYYARCHEYNTTDSVYKVADKPYSYNEVSRFDLTRQIGQKEASYLNKKDGKGSLWKSGDETSRFNEIKDIKAEANKQYPEHSIVFLRNDEFIDNKSNIIDRNPETIKKTGRAIKIQNFEGFSPEFIHLTEGSIHDVIETPERYKHKKLQDGVWVMGVTEPVLVLNREFIYEN